ncbi:hypothetical protein V8C37DRAFT_367773 [Trichoderma ceciliae]
MRSQPRRIFALPFTSTLDKYHLGSSPNLWRATNSRLTRIHGSGLLAAQYRCPSPARSSPYPASSSLAQHPKACAQHTDAAMNKDGKNIVSAMPVPWGRLKAWIEAQERAEQQGYNPQPMTKAQVAALSHLVEYMDEPEPDVSDRDYVSFLMQHVQYWKMPSPLYQDLEPVDVPVDGVFSLRWRTVCFLPSADHKEFPCLGHGLHKGRQAPLFKSKRMSKQYAAKHALQYLQSQPPPGNSSVSAPIPTSGGAPLRSTFSPLARSPAPGGGNVSAGFPPSAIPQGVAGGARLESPSPSSSLSPSSSTSDVAKGGAFADPKGEPMTVENAEFYSNPRSPSILEQVSREANRLGIGCPKYDIGPDPDRPGCYAGRPIFKTGGRIPPDMGYVSGALSKGLAKELIAEEVLKFCNDELKRRQGIIGSFQPKDSPADKE